ncbi:MAG: S-methyl-5'-thioadenosine phosphorylase [Dehalococcoidia bacterium]|nr:S-methyl-5'-thioadenosine phosphorylase [Dehalococcoidia bacterium]MQG16603.1 S-methyl-5'-thioadenosine phosphorylase [SAR202 cluster bacterium]|tara:strand:+ start:9527 stop:10381 length:855 start_codon:yes stop_codon:yes gene_type:complete
MKTINLAFIGGTGFYNIESLKLIDKVSIDTPFGPPSDTISIVEAESQTIAFLPRHGIGHNISPSNLPARANIYALKTLGIERLVSINAVGSLSEKIIPQEAVIPDQLIDRTYLRVNTFFDKSIVAYVSFANPFCDELSQSLFESSKIHMDTHKGGTMIVIEGPSFSTVAESRLYQKWGGDIIGMTALPEAKLAREAEICYTSLALVTDNDSWKIDDHVSQEKVASQLQSNAINGQAIIKSLIPKLISPRNCDCQNALANTIITKADSVDPSDYQRLKSIISKYV